MLEASNAAEGSNDRDGHDTQMVLDHQCSIERY